MSNSEFIVVSKSEQELRGMQKNLTTIDAQELIEHSEVFKKFLDKTSNTYRTKLALLEYKWNENFVYLAIELIEELKDYLDNFPTEYKSMLDLKEENADKSS